GQGVVEDLPKVMADHLRRAGACPTSGSGPQRSGIAWSTRHEYTRGKGEGNGKFPPAGAIPRPAHARRRRTTCCHLSAPPSAPRPGGSYRSKNVTARSDPRAAFVYVAAQTRWLTMETCSWGNRHPQPPLLLVAVCSYRQGPRASEFRFPSR